MITDLTGITQEMVDTEGQVLDEVMFTFKYFVGDLPIVAFNAVFDMRFLKNAGLKTGVRFDNPSICALTMARRAWPGRKSYKLSELAKDAQLPLTDNHRALGDSHRTLHLYIAATAKLGCHQ
jgi:DNA polymerase III alpha subunit (gram-positive type)